ncbi:hypothetical protein MA16_Dca029093 [Dendrobium catenatum]|uniref:Uncharacterized protein n=1 Tax=Dendrobium catenatum TaxID=906689 RepID=A0A2I0V8P0_9ASPA|nr:hypothetical protein MA16_Dca029093 [Dendrobium catenatum]
MQEIVGVKDRENQMLRLIVLPDICELSEKLDDTNPSRVNWLDREVKGAGGSGWKKTCKMERLRESARGCEHEIEMEEVLGQTDWELAAFVA